jgi:general secretion pathway protein A
MYLDHFGLYTDPFSLTPSLDFLYTSRACEETLAHLAFSLENGEAITLISGPIGIGKTLIVHSFLSHLGPIFEVALVNTTQVNYPELLKLILSDLGVDYPVGADRADLLALLRGRLRHAHEQRKRIVIVIDEAQDLAQETLEGVRLLTNLDQVDGRGLQVILIGQPDLERKVDSAGLVQLRQRIRVRYRLEPLSRQELAEYVAHRMRIAGCDRRVFQPAALNEIHNQSSGVPRIVNILAAEALMSAFLDDAKEVKAQHVEACAATETLEPPAEAAAGFDVAIERTVAGRLTERAMPSSAPRPTPAGAAGSVMGPEPAPRPQPQPEGSLEPAVRPQPETPRESTPTPEPTAAPERRTSQKRDLPPDRELAQEPRAAPPRRIESETDWSRTSFPAVPRRRDRFFVISLLCLLVVILMAWLFLWPRGDAHPILTGRGLFSSGIAMAGSPNVHEAATIARTSGGLTAPVTGAAAGLASAPAVTGDFERSCGAHAIHMASFRQESLTVHWS